MSALQLRRRGVEFTVRADARARADHAREAEARWRASRPIVLRRAIDLARRRGEIRSAQSCFRRERGRGDALRALAARRMRAPLVGAGTSVDVADAREILKVHADAVVRGRVVARDLWAKLSWVAADRRDRSLRIRFSFGSERGRDAVRDPRRAVWADRFADCAFPVCAAIARNAPVLRLLARLTRRRIRTSERILYANAPGGGAVFHHDAEPTQLGVVYAQLAGATAWLALPKRELAAELAAQLRRPAARVLRALDAPDQRLERALNASPALVARLVSHGALHLVRAGDAILLPSNGPDDVAWHSVFALGRARSLALSFGIFRR